MIEHYLKQLAHDYNTSLRTIYRHKSRVEANCPVARRSSGPRRIITWNMEQSIKHLLDERPWFYLDEI
jgi:hypothetical protein